MTCSSSECSFHSTSTLNTTSISNQHLGCATTLSESHAPINNRFLISPFSAPSLVDGCTMSDYNPGYHTDSIIPHYSSQFRLHASHGPLHDVLEKDVGLEYVEKPIFSDPQWLYSSPHTSTSAANGPFLLKKKQHRYTKRDLATHSVIKKRCRTLQYTMTIHSV